MKAWEGNEETESDGRMKEGEGRKLKATGWMKQGRGLKATDG